MSFQPKLGIGPVSAGLVSAAIGLGLAPMAHAQAGKQSSTEFALYTGSNHTTHANVKIKDAGTSYGIPDGNYDTDGWKSKPFESPVYYGWRITHWPDAKKEGLGYALDFTHSKIIAKRLPTPLTRLEFSDGMNTLVANVLYKYKPISGFYRAEPYTGAGLGISYPHVEVRGSTATRTYDYQYTGLAFQVLAGLRLPIADKWHLFGEFKSQYIPVDADLKGEGNLKADFVNHNVSLGLSRSF